MKLYGPKQLMWYDTTTVGSVTAAMVWSLPCIVVVRTGSGFVAGVDRSRTHKDVC